MYVLFNNNPLHKRSASCRGGGGRDGVGVEHVIIIFKQFSARLFNISPLDVNAELLMMERVLGAV